MANDLTAQEFDWVRREVAYRKRIAEEQGLDRLLLDAYHRSIRFYPAWMKSDGDERQYVYPEVSGAVEKITKSSEGEIFTTEFVVGKARYRVVSERRGTMIAHDLYYMIELFLNDQKVFAMSEKHDVRLKDRHYYTLSIEAYVNDDWVEDFRRIEAWQEQVDRKEAERKPTEDPQVVERLKKDFNLGGGSLIRMRAWPRYKVFRLVLLLVILVLAFVASLEFSALVRR